MRVGLGCMRLSTDPNRDEARGLATLRAALERGVTVLDTAHAYGQNDADLGHNERLIARAVREADVDPARIRVVTKCGMRRPDGGWRPDGRAATIAEDARASLDALGGLAIDVMLLHSPDPRTPFATSVRALARVKQEGIARAIGLSNVSLAELDEALLIAPVTSVELALGAFDDASARGGVVRACGERGIEVLAHSPFGGPKRARRLLKDATLAEIGKALGVTAPEVFLAYLLAVHPAIVPLAGARTPETAASALSASGIELDASSLARLDERFPALGDLRRPPKRPAPRDDKEVVVVMGIPGAGKSRAAEAWVARGYERLNRDAVGGSLRALARSLDERLAAGASRVVLDNTYTTRKDRHDVVRAAHAHGALVRCVLLDTPAHEAQVNVVLRMLRKYGALLEPEAIAHHAKTDANMVRPTVLFRMLRELEPPSRSEGFDAIELVAFERVREDGETFAGGLVALEAITEEVSGKLALRDDAGDVLAKAPPGAACLVVAWRPGADDAWRDHVRSLLEEAPHDGRELELGVCTHPAGPPVCWCRPPLPGLWLAFAERRRIAPDKSVIIGERPVYGSMARALGLRASC